MAVAKARPWARCGLLGFDGPAALAMFLECIRDVGEWVREGWLRFWGRLKATSRRWFVGGEACRPCAAAAFLPSLLSAVAGAGAAAAWLSMSIGPPPAWLSISMVLVGVWVRTQPASVHGAETTTGTHGYAVDVLRMRFQRRVASISMESRLHVS